MTNDLNDEVMPVDPLPIGRREAPDIARREDERFSLLVRSLASEDWLAPTACEGWDVRSMALHVLGAAEAHDVRELVHQMRAGRRAASGRSLVDGVNDVQIADRRHLTIPEVLTRLEVAVPEFERFRRRLPRPVRWIRVPAPGVGSVSMGALMDVIYTRDSWLHRVDIHQAIGREQRFDGHDARIVSDVVAEWARRHEEPYRLVLTGPAGGTYGRGDGGERIEIDAVEFCRVLSGRSHGDGLLTTPVLF
jgi:uncharacterized protein (TIGR03083 family)